LPALAPEDDLTDTEVDLLQRARRGDGDAYATLVRPHERTAMRVAASVLGTSSGADDVVQEALTRAYLALPGFRQGSPFRPWFLRIVANTARNARRATGRRARLALRARPLEHGPPDPQEHAVSDSDRRVVLAALNRLGADDRLVIALRHFEELTEEEMAIVLECPAGTVKSRLSRAMARLRAELERVSDDG